MKIATNDTMRTLGSASAAICAALIGVGLTQVGFAQQPTIRSVITSNLVQSEDVPVNNPPPLGALSSAGEMFLPDGDPGHLGWTFDYDSVNGGFILRQRLFTGVPNDDTGTPQTKVFFKTVFSSQSAELKHSTHFGIAGGLGVVKFASSLANSSEVNSSILGTEFRLAIEAQYPAFRMDPLSIPLTSLSPVAQQVLSISNPAQRYQAWKTAGFGDYVAYGYDLAGGLEFSFSMSQADSFRSASTVFDASATYQGVTGTFGVASAIKDTVHSGTMAYSLSSFGCFAPPLPQEIDVIDQGAQQHYAGVLNDWVSGQSPQNTTPCKQRRGIWLLPVSGMPIGINTNLPIWSDDVLDSAAEQAQAAAETLWVSSKWNYTPSMSSFLHAYTRPGLTIAFDDALFDARADLGPKLNVLKLAVFHYLDGDNATDPAASDAVTAAADVVRDGVRDLQEILDELRDLTAVLPPLTVTLHENFTPASGPCVYGWRPFTIEIDNVAAFTNGTYQSIWNWAHRREGAEASIVIRDDEECNTHYNVPRYMGGDIQNPSVYETVYPSGLKKLTIPCMVLAYGPDQYFKCEVLDDFSRFVPSPWIDANYQN